MSTHWLESGHWISQIGLAVVALFAAIVAFRQTRTFKLFQMLKSLESPEMKRARRIVVREIDPRRDERWRKDKDADRPEAAASDVCAAYDVLAKMVKFDRMGYGRFFETHWERSIVGNHDALDGFLRYRWQNAPNAYSDFTTLAEKLRRHAGLRHFSENDLWRLRLEGAQGVVAPLHLKLQLSKLGTDASGNKHIPQECEQIAQRLTINRHPGAVARQIGE